MIIDDIQTNKSKSAQKAIQQDQQSQKYLTLSSNLQYLLQLYQLQSVQQLIQTISCPQLSSQLKSNNAQFSQIFVSQLQLSQKLKKIALQHTYQQMYIYYQQIPLQIQQCKKVLKYKYRHDDILRTHQNRKSIWMLCSGALNKIKQNHGYYDKLTKSRQITPEFFKNTIDKDVVRTNYDKNNKQHENQLSNILRNFAIRNPYIGYCQGMNFIANFLILMQFTQQQSFWLLTQLLQQFLPKTYYTNMMGIAVDIYIVQQYIRIHYPNLYDKLQQMNLSLNMFTLQWLVCLFSTTLPFYMLVIIWDMLFIQGPTVLLKVCIVILDQLEQTILNTKDLSQLLLALESKKKGIFIEQDQFINRISNIYIDNYLLDICRQMVQIKLLLQKHQMSNHTKPRIPKKTPFIHCSISWPVCFKALKQHKSDMSQIQVWSFRQQGPLKIIHDYLILKKKSIYNYKQLQYEKSDQKKLLIGRIAHVCNQEEYNKQYENGENNIELEEYDMLHRRNIQTSLVNWGIRFNNNQNTQNNNNTPFDFYRKATASKLAFLQIKSSMKNSSEKNTINSPKRKQIRNKKEKLTNSLIIPQKVLDNFKINSQSFSQNSQTQKYQLIKNPFKKLKDKLRGKK